MTESIQTRMERCEIHGEYRSRQKGETGQWTGCWHCFEVKLQEQDQQDQQREAERHAEAEREALIAASGMEGRMLRSGFKNFIAESDAQRRVLQTCQAFAETVELDARSNLWLVGQPGTGKTHLGSAMVRYFIHKRGTPAAIFSAREIVRMLRASWGRRDDMEPAETEEEIIRRLGSIGLLVLDEIGVGFSSDAERVQLFDVLDLRYKLGRPTVVLSNLSSKDMKPILGDRLHDRLRDGAQVLICNWPSFRKGAA